jgi:membrane protease YdiL (CAAX protease family)
MPPETATVTAAKRAVLRPGILSLVVFFIAVFVATWVVWVPRALDSRGLLGADWAVTLGLGWTYIPALTAVLFVALTRGRSGLGELRRALLRWRIGWRWFAVILTLPLGIAFVTAVIYALAGGQFSQGLPLAFDLPPALIPMIVAIRVLTDGIGEETGWRGYALPRLLQHTNAVTASLVLGVVWALWHLPLIFTRSATMADNSIPVLLALLPAEAIVYTWVYQHTNHSILAAALLHALIGLSLATSPAAEASGQPQVIRLILWWVVAIALIAKNGRNLVRDSAGDVTGDGRPDVLGAGEGHCLPLALPRRVVGDVAARLVSCGPRSTVRRRPRPAAGLR